MIWAEGTIGEFSKIILGDKMIVAIVISNEWQGGWRPQLWDKIWRRVATKGPTKLTRLNVNTTLTCLVSIVNVITLHRASLF